MPSPPALLAAITFAPMFDAISVSIHPSLLCLRNLVGTSLALDHSRRRQFGSKQRCKIKLRSTHVTTPAAHCGRVDIEQVEHAPEGMVDHTLERLRSGIERG